MPKLKDFITAENELDGQEYAYISQTDKTRKTTIQKIKDFILGTATLTTTDKTIKGAINELDSDLGDKTTLTTTDKTSLVNAINENTAHLSEKANQNEIINGNLDFWQRGTSLVNLAHATFLADRFRTSISISGTAPTTITHSRQIITSGELEKSTYFYRIATSDAGVFNPNDKYSLLHAIENGVRRLCGNGKNITISFYARSSIPGKKLGVNFGQNYGTGGSPTSEDIVNGSYVTLTNNWTKYKITLSTTTITGKTFGSNNDDSLKLSFNYAYGSSFASTSGDTIAETFRGAGYIDIAQIKLESGDKATPFVPRLYGEELALCKRYYQRQMIQCNPLSSNNVAAESSFIVHMRANPTVTLNPATLFNHTTSTNVTFTITGSNKTADFLQNLTSSDSNLIGGHNYSGLFYMDAEIY